MHVCFFTVCLLDTEWQVANTELVDRQNYMVKNLPTGEKMDFRVVAVNIAGRSPPACLAQPVKIREIMGISEWENIMKILWNLNKLNCWTGTLLHSYVLSFSSFLSEHPKIRLPRHLRTKYIKRVGETINLVIPFQVCLCFAVSIVSVSFKSSHVVHKVLQVQNFNLNVSLLALSWWYAHYIQCSNTSEYLMICRLSEMIMKAILQMI